MYYNALFLSAVLSIALGCSTQTNVTKFILNSHKNETGHWVAQVSLEHGVDLGPLEVELDHKTINCEKEERVLVVTTITARPPDTGYEFLPEFGLYKIHNEKLNWFRARQTCTKEHAHLVIINSEKEFSRLKLLGKIEGDFYTSINDLEKEGHFVTQFGDSLNTTGYMKWFTGEPNQGAAGNCIRVSPSTGNMADGDCNANFAFICEKQLT